MKNFKDFELTSDQKRSAIGKGGKPFEGAPNFRGKPDFVDGLKGGGRPVVEEPEMEEPEMDGPVEEVDVAG